MPTSPEPFSRSARRTCPDRVPGEGVLDAEVLDAWYQAWVEHPNGPELDPARLDLNVAEQLGDFLSRLDLGVKSVTISNRRAAVRSCYFPVTFDLEKETSSGTISLFILGVALFTTKDKVLMSHRGIHPMLVNALTRALGKRIEFHPSDKRLFYIKPIASEG
jgi:hypothetical protein